MTTKERFEEKFPALESQNYLDRAVMAQIFAFIESECTHREEEARRKTITECIEALQEVMAASDVERKYVQITLQEAIQTLKSLLK